MLFLIFSLSSLLFSSLPKDFVLLIPPIFDSERASYPNYGAPFAFHSSQPGSSMNCQLTFFPRLRCSSAVGKYLRMSLCTCRGCKLIRARIQQLSGLRNNSTGISRVRKLIDSLSGLVHYRSTSVGSWLPVHSFIMSAHSGGGGWNAQTLSDTSLTNSCPNSLISIPSKWCF